MLLGWGCALPLGLFGLVPFSVRRKSVAGMKALIANDTAVRNQAEYTATKPTPWLASRKKPPALSIETRHERW